MKGLMGSPRDIALDYISSAQRFAKTERSIFQGEKGRVHDGFGLDGEND